MARVSDFRNGFYEFLRFSIVSYAMSIWQSGLEIFFSFDTNIRRKLLGCSHFFSLVFSANSNVHGVVMMSIQTDPGLVKRGAMGLGHARGVLDMHRGHFRFYLRGAAKPIVETRLMRGFLAKGVDDGQSRPPLTLGISSWFIFFLHLSMAMLVFLCE